MNSTSNIVISAFGDRLEAERAVDELEQAGFAHHDIGFALRGEDVVEGGMITDATGTKDAQGAVRGITAGGLIGGVLGAAAAATVPGAGPVVAGGILAGMAGGAAAGVAVGGIFGALSGLGASEEEAVYYQNEFESGKAIVTVNAGGRANEAAEILHRHGGYTPTIHH